MRSASTPTRSGCRCLPRASRGVRFFFSWVDSQLSTFDFQLCLLLLSPPLCPLQLLYNPHLRAPLGSAGNKGLITPLESALTGNSPATPLESALTKTGGVGSFREFTLDHPSSRVLEIRPGQCRRLSLRGLGGFSELRRLWGAGAPDHPCEFFRRGRPAHASRIARCRVRALPARWSILCRVVRTRKVRRFVTNRDSHVLRRCRVMRRQGKRDGEVNSPLQNGRRAALKDRVYTGAVGKYDRGLRKTRRTEERP